MSNIAKFSSIFILLFIRNITYSLGQEKPNILVILADDLHMELPLEETIFVKRLQETGYRIPFPQH